MARRKNPAPAQIVSWGALAAFAATVAYYFWQKRSSDEAAALAVSTAPQQSQRPQSRRGPPPTVRVYATDGTVREVSYQEAARLVASGDYMWNARQTAISARTTPVPEKRGISLGPASSGAEVVAAYDRMLKTTTGVGLYRG